MHWLTARPTVRNRYPKEIALYSTYVGIHLLVHLDNYTKKISSSSLSRDLTHIDKAEDGQY